MTTTAVQSPSRAHPEVPSPSAVRATVPANAPAALALLALALLLLPLPGCQSVTGAPAVAQLRIIDASPDTGALDLYQGPTVLAYKLGFGTVTSYVSISPGAYTLAASPTGTRTPLVAAPGTFANGGQYTALLGDFSASMREIILKDQSQPAPPGQVSLRFLDESSAAGPVDLYLVPSGSTISSVSPFLTNVTPGRNSGYLILPAGTYTLVALPTGTFATPATGTLYTGPAVPYPSGAARTLVLLNQTLLNTPGLQVLAAVDFDPLASN